jgi:hypothetical protein
MAACAVGCTGVTVSSGLCCRHCGTQLFAHAQLDRLAPLMCTACSDSVLDGSFAAVARIGDRFLSLLLHAALAACLPVGTEMYCFTDCSAATVRIHGTASMTDKGAFPPESTLPPTPFALPALPWSLICSAQPNQCGLQLPAAGQPPGPLTPSPFS